MPRRDDKPSRDNDLGAVLDALPIGLYVVDRDLRVVAWNRLREEGPLGRPREQAVGRPLRRCLGSAGLPRHRARCCGRFSRTGRGSDDTVETPSGTLPRAAPAGAARARGHARRLLVRGHHGAPRDRDAPHRRGPPRVPRPARLRRGPRDLEPPRRDRRLRGGARVARRARPAQRRARGAAVPRPDPPGGRALRGDRALPARLLARRRTRRRPTSRAPWRSRCACSSATPPSPACGCARRSRPGCRAARIGADSLKQVVMALAVNASAAMPSGGTLAVRAARLGRALHLDVADTGAPVPREARREPLRAVRRHAMPSGERGSGWPSPGACSAAAGAISSTGPAGTATSSAWSCGPRQVQHELHRIPRARRRGRADLRPDRHPLPAEGRATRSRSARTERAP